MDSTTQANNDRKQRYMILHEDIANINNSIGTQSSSEMCKAFDKLINTCNDMHKESKITEKLENTSEVVLDAQIIKSTHESMSRLLLANSEFNDGMYQNAICALISNNESDNWQYIMNIAIHVSCSIATKSSMLGAIDVEPRERVLKERQQRRRTTLTQEKQPETIKQLKRDDRGAEKVNIILKQVSDLFRSNGCQPIPYYKLIIDPNDFMNTVENAFQMAFLARDGNIAIESGSDGNPQVRVASKDEIQMHQDTTQSICSLNMELCERMIVLYGIQRPILNVPVDADNRSNENESD